MRRTAVSFGLGLWLAACNGSGDSADKPGTTADSDTDSDTDSDADVDADSDSDTDTDTDTTPPAEICDDGFDNDGDGAIDCDDADCSLTCDADQDGAIDRALGGTDCNDADAAINPAATEVCDTVDDDCDGKIDEADPSLDLSTAIDQWDDADGDTFGGAETHACTLLAGNVLNGDDCDDGRPAVNPLATEICNHLDDNCDGLTDEQDPTIDPALLTTFWADADHDGLGDAAAPILACFQGPYAANADDCDDTDPSVGAPHDWFADLDHDGFGAGPVVEADECAPVDPTLVGSGSDCADGDAAINPAATEICDSVDDDCDNLIDDADPSVDLATGIPQWRDLDGDSYGASPTAACVLRPGNVLNGDDCNDGNAAINPAAPEICNHLDDDCDALVDDADPSIDPALLTTFFTDADRDGYGDPLLPVDACFQGRFALAGDDCDDADPTVAAATDWYADEDQDGVGAGAVVEAAVCAPSDPALVASSDDCGPLDATIYPGAVEICGDGLDQDCDGYDLCHPLLSGAMLASDAEVFLYGESLGQYAGVSTQVADVDLDGDAELLEAGIWGSAAAGTQAVAHVWDGPWADGSYDLGNAALVISGERADSEFILALQVPDLTGDGLDDVVVGDAGYNGGSGRTYVLPGPLAAGGPIAGLAAASLDGPAGSFSGYTFATQDVDADGDLELWDEAIFANFSYGEVYVVEGPVAGNSLLSAHGSALAGTANDPILTYAMGSDDFDGDGLPEMAIGAGTAALTRGAVFVFEHTPVGVETPANADQRIDGLVANDAFGFGLAPTGDVTGDGLPDLLVGAPQANGFGGVVWLLAGPLGPLAAATAQIDGVDQFGYTVADAGDLDQDGSEELAVTGFCPYCFGGGVTNDLFLLDLDGAAGVLLDVDVTQLIVRDDGGEYLGFRNTGGGDLDADGYPDFPIAAPYADSVSGVDSGGVRLLFGSEEL